MERLGAGAMGRSREAGAVKPVDQTTFGHPGGNCFSACVASLLELPIEDVPYFMDEAKGKWHEQFDAWLAPRGLYALHFEVPDRSVYDQQGLWPRGYFILNGRTTPSWREAAGSPPMTRTLVAPD